MPGNVRKDDAARRVALNILGPPANGLADSFGNKKRFVKSKNGKKDAEELYQERLDPQEINNRFEDIGYR